MLCNGTEICHCKPLGRLRPSSRAMAKQSSVPHKRPLDCFVANAPRNDDAVNRSRDAPASESSSRNVTPSTKWSAGRRQGRGPRHADGCCHPLALRARRAPQTIPSRKPPAPGALRLPALHHSPPLRLSTAAAREPHLLHLQDRLRNGAPFDEQAKYLLT